ncbi:ABC transporter ATP-binding protein [Haploplasma axanthum]|uniref:ABC transporter ATP-binding protein n=1 Tax=Haploplasma axanthum TaxID=29552 RepID=A0A449BDJ0_HAPAX|nr:ABC transporter ATP-binding protein [Haploplasma axanthum]VEU80370.1 ABC transporter ATP-binding protein [Haploplasma axanthum]
MLEIKNLSKSYVPGIKALDNVNVNIANGEIFAFIGHNGAGKTTAIKSIVGILSFEEGEILLDGVNIKNAPIEFKKMTAYIPDNPELYDNLTGIQYLNFIANIYKLDVEKRNDDIVKYSRDFEIYEDLGNLISSYSHGMKQKLALISAFIRHPKLLILDEPFVGLDPNATFKMKTLMKEMADAGSIIFFSTHVLEVAEKFCDHVAIIKKGKIMKIGTMNEVKGDKSLETVFMEMTDSE